MDPDVEAVVVLCTVPESGAAALADRILEARLAACVNLVGPVRSRYWWEGRIESSDETLLLIKTTAAAVGALRDAISEWHEYDVPEVLALPVAAGLPAYLSWIAAHVDA